MRNTAAVLCAVLAVAAAGCQPPAPTNPEAERLAVEAAETWLKIIDAGDFAGAWDATAPYLRTMAPKDRWVESVESVRGVLGQTVSREPSSKQYVTGLPTAPDGEYVIVYYKSVLEHKQAATEAVVVMKTEDGTWRVSGYNIQ